MNERIYKLGGRGPDQYFNDIDVHGSGVISVPAACSADGRNPAFVFQATPGWDYATGWGSPNARTLIPALADQKLKFTRRNVRVTGRISQRVFNTQPGAIPLQFANFVGNTTVSGFNTLSMNSFRMVHLTASGGVLGGGGGTNTTTTVFIDVFGMDPIDGQPNVPAYDPVFVNPISGQGLLLAPGSPINFTRNGNDITGHAFYLITIGTTNAGGGGGGGTTTNQYLYYPVQFRGKINKGKITGDFFTQDANGQRVKGAFNTSGDAVISGHFEG